MCCILGVTLTSKRVTCAFKLDAALDPIALDLAREAAAFLF